MPAAAQDLQKEAEQKLLESIKIECRKILDMMKAAQPTEAERLKSRLDEVVKRATKLPLDFKKKVMGDARNFECIANTRAADAALQGALGKARQDDGMERNRLVGEARRFANKAISLGADASFRASLNRKIEIIMMTGKVEQKGPTVAKPLDTTPKPQPSKN